ncbi:helix-turn-helix transcriptional regulator [Ruania halotolerans]|uniref:helix-turn-helix transcriptional regulator n=1 Tax=Ruania halotolerans TaxID=2897773 RepID=UPI001E43974A|nr:helix-turn-helix transcriptional regulator [Ruania halotolerans]UFU05942.1 helix-turn-helix transcriptional regulator [Ruania halotolerans]
MTKQAVGLGDFLRSRRAQIAPESAGVVTYGFRRVTGLRREELAELAGVSLTYYTRLEQGNATNASDAVLDALARALGLDAIERAHLFSLARGGVPRPAAGDPYSPRPSTLTLLDSMAEVPTVLLARNQDILAWNRLGHALIASHLDPSAPTRGQRPNATRMLFLDPATRTLYRDWGHEACLTVASLRYVAGQHPDDERLQAMIHDLRTESGEFDALWRRQPVDLCISGVKRLRHPRVGDLTVSYEILHLAEATGQRLLTHTSVPGSPDADAVRVLASTTLT